MTLTERFGHRRTVAISVVSRLSIAELRAQRILYRSRWVSALSVLGLAGVLVGIGSRIFFFVQHGVDAGTLNLAILSCGAAFISFANTTITGVENRASPNFTRAWVRRWPLSERMATSFIVMNQVARGLALSITLFITIAIAASLASGSALLTVQSLTTALAFPIPGVLLALLVPWKEHSRTFGRVFIAILGILIIVIANPLPTPDGPLGVVAKMVAAPALLLLAQPVGVEAVPFLVLWVAVFAIALVLGIRAVRDEATAGSSRLLLGLSRYLTHRRMPIAGLMVLRFSLLTAVMGLCVVVFIPLLVVSSAASAIPAGAAGSALLSAEMVAAFVTSITISHLLVRGVFEGTAAEQDYLLRAPIRGQHADDVRLWFSAVQTVPFVFVSIAVLALTGHAINMFSQVVILGVLIVGIAGLEFAQRQRTWARIAVGAGIAGCQLALILVTLLATYGLLPASGGAAFTALISLLAVLPLLVRPTKGRSAHKLGEDGSDDIH